MRAIILYASKSGNTQKIADAMASTLGCKAIKITAQSTQSLLGLEQYDLIFLGTGLYAGIPNEDIVKFLRCLNFKSQRQFVLFITWGGAPKSDKIALGKLRTLLKENGQKVLPDHFASYGGWKGVLMKRGYPKPEEIQAAGVWAKQLLEKMEKMS